MVPSVLLQGESTAWKKLWENKSEQTRGRKWARNFPTQELLDADGGFGGFSETLLKEKEARGPEFGWVLITAITANTQSRQKPGRQAASLSHCACDLITALQVKVPAGSGVETGEQPWQHLLSWNCGRHTWGCRSSEARRKCARTDMMGSGTLLWFWNQRSWVVWGLGWDPAEASMLPCCWTCPGAQTWTLKTVTVILRDIYVRKSKIPILLLVSFLPPGATCSISLPSFLKGEVHLSHQSSCKDCSKLQESYGDKKLCTTQLSHYRSWCQGTCKHI